jgi:uncharacterized protein YjbI with pentapeptide repeats
VVRFRSWWQTIRKPLAVGIIVASVLGIALIVAIIGGYLFHWSGTGLSQKTLWDWLQLLIIPLALAIIAILFNRAERKNEQRIASDNQREAALQMYIDKMSELLLQEKLRTSAEEDEVRKIARARTLTVLRGLDAIRKASVLEFLYESGLIDKNKRIIDLSGAYLSGVEQWNSNLSGADLSGANLSKAFLMRVNLSGADLNGANLSEANLSEANLKGANLSNAKLEGTNLSEANLKGANLSNAALYGTNLSKADLSGANLSGAEFGDYEVDPPDTQWFKINLSGADLSGVDLSGADLTPELLGQAKSLIGTTMPDGSKHP